MVLIFIVASVLAFLAGMSVVALSIRIVCKKGDYLIAKRQPDGTYVRLFND